MEGTAFHWEAAAPRADHSQCAAQVEDIRRYHLSVGYADIAYSWLVCDHGVIFMGRGWDRQSAATCNGYWNSRVWSVCWMGGPGYSPSPAALGAMRFLWDESVRRGARYAIGHRDACSTQCPGDDIWNWVHGGLPPVAPPVRKKRRQAMLVIDQGTGAVWLLGVGAARWIQRQSEVSELQFVLEQDQIPWMNGLVVISWMMKFGAWSYELNAPLSTN